PPPVLRLHFKPSLFRRRRTHHELHRTGDHHHRLPLTVDIPLRRRLLPVLLHTLLNPLIPLVPPIPALRPVLVHVFQPCLLFPLPYQPFHRCVQPRITLATVQPLHLRQRRRPGCRRQTLLPILPQTQEQRPPDRKVRLLVQTPEDGPDLGPQGRQPMNQVAPHPRIIGGSSPQQRPDLPRLIQPQQCHRRIRLPPSQLLPPRVR